MGYFLIQSDNVLDNERIIILDLLSKNKYLHSYSMITLNELKKVIKERKESLELMTPIGTIDFVTVYLKGYSVKCSLDSVTFDKTYRLAINRSVEVTGLLIFSDLCRTLKIHPAKELLKSKRLWNNATQCLSEYLLSEEYIQTHKNSNINKITPLSINIGESKYEVELGFYNNEILIGKRIVVVDFNYKNFNMHTSKNRSIRALANLNCNDISDMVFSLHYKYSSDDRNDYKMEFETVAYESNVYFALRRITLDLIRYNKKYQD